MKLFVESIAILAPGLNGWAAAQPVLAGASPYEPVPLAPPTVDLLPAVERRRTGAMVKMALAVGHAALSAAGRPLESVATVFTSSGGDGDVINDICVTLAGPDRQLSPTRFHNSVHNAPAGYWSIATHSHHPSTSLCGFDWSFPIGLLEAAAQVQVDRHEVLLVAFDTPYPFPLAQVRPLTDPFGTALVFARERGQHTLAELDIAMDATAQAVTQMENGALERLRRGNPCARALPLLAALAGTRPRRVTLQRDAGQTLSIAVTPS
ncbi:MAG TPA: beta-ketoacyl synthase chain length factor [Burkholderiales bacterium]